MTRTLIILCLLVCGCFLVGERRARSAGAGAEFDLPNGSLEFNLQIVRSASGNLKIELRTPVAQQDTFEKVVQPFFAQNCYACHDEAKQTKDLNLEAFKTTSSLRKDRGTMQMVLDKLKAGEMPPAKMPRPNPQDLAAVTDWLTHQLAEGPEKTSAPAPTETNAGRVTMRRLN